MSHKPTPTHHGAWRVFDGQLVDESEQPKPELLPYQRAWAEGPESKPVAVVVEKPRRLFKSRSKSPKE